MISASTQHRIFWQSGQMEIAWDAVLFGLIVGLVAGTVGGTLAGLAGVGGGLI